MNPGRPRLAGQIVSGIFSSHNAMRLGINYKKKTVKSTNTCR